MKIEELKKAVEDLGLENVWCTTLPEEEGFDAQLTVLVELDGVDEVILNYHEEGTYDRNGLTEEDVISNLKEAGNTDEQIKGYEAVLKAHGKFFKED